MIKTKKIQFFSTLFCMLFMVLACTPQTDEATPTLIPSPTRSQIIPRNENVEALNAAQAALNEQKFGFAPLLQDNRATIILETINSVEVPRLNYPQQPVNPADWPNVDSFVSAYSVRQFMINMSQVNRVALGHLNIPASIDTTSKNIDHTAAWVTFLDGSRAIIDLSPLAANFASRHIPDRMIIDSVEIENTFADRRKGVNLDTLQPMLIQEDDTGQLYYLLAQVEVSFDRYVFSLYVHPVEPADPITSMSIRPGVVAQVDIKRTELEALQELAIDHGDMLFVDEPQLLIRQGSTSQEIDEILDNNLHLLWHLVTKFEHQDPNSDVPTPTPTVTPTPVPTSTPTPTATPRKLPLVTS